ncbi:CDK5 regulatory subunit associated protein 2 [Mactra antiquata]
MAWNVRHGSNPNLLTEVTYGEVGVAPMMEKSSTGRMSPVRGRTMKEYDQHITELKKENFDLKLRIFFMEERINTKYNEETVIQNNIELKVELQKCKQDIMEKQAVLEKASETIGSLTEKFSDHVEKEVSQIKQQCDENVELAEQKVAAMEKDMAAMEEQLSKLQDDCDTILKPQLEEKDKQIQNLQANLENRDREIVELEDKVSEMKREITKLKSLKDKQQSQFLNEVETLRTSLGRKDRDIQDQVDDAKRELEKAKEACDKKNKDLEAKGRMIGQLEDLLRQKEKEKDDLNKAFGEKNVKYNKAKDLIVQLTTDAVKNGEKAASLEVELLTVQDQLDRMRKEALQAEYQRQKVEDQMSDLENNLEKLTRSLGKKEGEIENFRDLLKKAQKSLTMSEAAVESLQEQLENERCKCKEKHSNQSSDEDVKKLKKELADLHDQLTDREKQYRSKCAELDAVAQRLNINVTTKHDGYEQSDMLNKIMNELQGLKGAVQSERHLHIDINSHLSPESGFSSNLQPESSHSTHRSSESSLKSHLLSDKTDNTTTTSHGVQTSLDEIGFEVFSGKDGDCHHKFPVVDKKGSQIPIRCSKSSSSSSLPGSISDNDNSQMMTKLKAEVQRLRNTLKATEETVHNQTRKMKHYRHMLVENGLLPRSRSNSVPAGLNKLSSTSPGDLMFETDQLSHEVSINRASRCRSVSPTPVCRRYSNDETRTLTEDSDTSSQENSKLKHQLDGYKRVLKVFQDRSSSPAIEHVSKPEDAGPAPISSESASQLLDGWLNKLDNFLADISQCDQEGPMFPPTSTMEVAQLRRGLVQARGVVQALSDTSLAPQDKLSDGRLSPDSGCSDKSLSGHTLKESPDNSLRSNNSFSSRDAGMDPHHHCTNSDIHTLENFRHCGEFTEPSNISLYGLDGVDESVTSTCRMGSVHGDCLFEVPVSHFGTRGGGGVKSLSDRMPTKHSDVIKNRFEKTFSCSYLAGNESLSTSVMNTSKPINDVGDRSLLDITLNTTMNKTNTAELQERMKSLENIIRSYEEKMDNQAGPSMESLQDHLNELRHLRLLLEECLERNTHLEGLLYDLYTSSEKEIDHLKQRLNDSHVIIQQKLTIITEKEKIIRKNNADLEQYQDNSAKENTELQFYRDRVTSLEKELQDEKSTSEKLKDMCQLLKTAVEQSKNKTDQYEVEKRSHMDAVYRYKNKVEDLEKELKIRTEDENKVESTFNELKTQLEDLQSEATKWRENETKYQKIILQSESQMSQLSTDLEATKNELDQKIQDLTILKEQYDQKTQDMAILKENFEHKIDVIEKQNEDINDKADTIDNLKTEMIEKDSILHEQDSLCMDLTTKMEALTVTNGTLLTQLEQYKHSCVDHKRLIEKQNHTIQELKNRCETMKKEITQMLQDRKYVESSMSKKEEELKEASRLRDKYLHNLKFTCKEYNILKKEHRETRSLNKSLQTELKIRERLMDQSRGTLTDDEKQGIIDNLLEELKIVRLQVIKVLYQSRSIGTKMTEILQQMKDRKSYQPTSTQFTDIEMEIHTKTSSESTDLHNGRPDSDLFDGMGRREAFSMSFPVRESTTDGACSFDDDRLSCSLPNSISSQSSSKTECLEKLHVDDVADGQSKVTTDKDAVSTGHFSVPGPIYKQHVTDQCLIYNVNDSPKYLAGITQVKIDSDARTVFSVGMIDHFEKLRKEANECNVILKGLTTLITERLKVLSKMSATEMIKSVEYSTLKELSYAADYMTLCLKSQLSMIDCFWVSELPAPNEKGEFVNHKLVNEITLLQDEVRTLSSQHVRDSGGRTSQMKEEDICRSLESTLDMITSARQNFEHQQKHT